MLVTLQSREDREPASRRRTKNILIVDDSESVRVATRLVIESCTDFRVCGEASHGVEAINKAQYLNPDVVIMDLAMPEMNGVEAANLLKQRMPEVQIVLFTAMTEVYPLRRYRYSASRRFYQTMMALSPWLIA